MKKNLVIYGLLSVLCILTGCNKDEVQRDGIKDGAVTAGVFTVAKGKTVRFSMGNLQYNASSKTYRFALQQYAFVGEDNLNISNSYNGWIDLFAGGSGDKPTVASEDIEDYPTAFVDWGKNPISNAGNKANQWRTLSAKEWRYLILSRPNAYMLYSTATLTIDDNEIYGLILLPDEWKAPSGLSLDCSEEADYWSNIYDASEWAKLEAAGAVFLPAAGYRYAKEEYEQYELDEMGTYWTSTPYSDEPTVFYTFFIMEEREEYAYAVGETAMGYGVGCSVRLVQDL